MAFLRLAVLFLTLGLGAAHEDESSMMQWKKAKDVQHADNAKSNQTRAQKLKTTVDRIAGMAKLVTNARELILRKPLDCAFQKNPLWMLTGHTPLASGGHADPHAWCQLHPEYVSAASECIKGNLTGFAQVMYATKKEQRDSDWLLKNDAQYCFLSGHCDNTEVTESTTMSQAEVICNKTVGFENWGSIDGWHYGIANNLIKLTTKYLNSKSTVNLDKKFSSSVAEVSCAMGSYHCDVVYCREHFCQDPDYKQKYAKLSPKK